MIDLKADALVTAADAARRQSVTMVAVHQERRPMQWTWTVMTIEEWGSLRRRLRRGTARPVAEAIRVEHLKARR